MKKIEISTDVTEVLPAEVRDGGAKSISAWVFYPDNLVSIGGQPAVMFLLNGGTYDKRYFEVDGKADYSAAKILTDKGYVVVLLDHFGTGDSSRANDERLITRQVAATANDAAVRQIGAQLKVGSLALDIPPLGEFLCVGGGHSMGGMQTITTQANHQTYDCVLVLGYTAIGVHLTVDEKIMSADLGPIREDEPQYYLHDRSRLREQLSLGRCAGKRDCSR